MFVQLKGIKDSLYHLIGAINVTAKGTGTANTQENGSETVKNNFNLKNQLCCKTIKIKYTICI